jgi:hypothetical protein
MIEIRNTWDGFPQPDDGKTAIEQPRAPHNFDEFQSGLLLLKDKLKILYQQISQFGLPSRDFDSETKIIEEIRRANEYKKESSSGTITPFRADYLTLRYWKAGIFVKIKENSPQPGTKGDADSESDNVKKGSDEKVGRLLQVVESGPFKNLRPAEIIFVIYPELEMKRETEYKEPDLLDGLDMNVFKEYDVALSYAGEDRGYVDKVADYLRKSNLHVLHDNFEENDPRGGDLFDRLENIYREKAKYCVMFLPKPDMKTGGQDHEDIYAEHILPVLLDDTVDASAEQSSNYINGNEYSPEELAEMIISKCSRK